jgi:hypothetical protein
LRSSFTPTRFCCRQNRESHSTGSFSYCSRGSSVLQLLHWPLSSAQEALIDRKPHLQVLLQHIEHVLGRDAVALPVVVQHHLRPAHWEPDDRTCVGAQRDRVTAPEYTKEFAPACDTVFMSCGRHNATRTPGRTAVTRQKRCAHVRVLQARNTAACAWGCGAGVGIEFETCAAVLGSAAAADPHRSWHSPSQARPHKSNCSARLPRRPRSTCPYRWRSPYLESQLGAAAGLAGHRQLAAQQLDVGAIQRLHGVARGAHQLPGGRHRRPRGQQWGSTHSGRKGCVAPPPPACNSAGWGGVCTAARPSLRRVCTYAAGTARADPDLQPTGCCRASPLWSPAGCARDATYPCPRPERPKRRSRSELQKQGSPRVLGGASVDRGTLRCALGAAQSGAGAVKRRPGPASGCHDSPLRDRLCSGCTAAAGHLRAVEWSSMETVASEASAWRLVLPPAKPGAPRSEARTIAKDCSPKRFISAIAWCPAAARLFCASLYIWAKKDCTSAFRCR